MKYLMPIVLVVGFIGAVAAPVAAQDWETVTADSAKIAVPKGWRSMDGLKRTMPIFRQGDGIGVPALDESGAPLQIGLTVEKFPPASETTEAIAQELAKNATKNPQLELVGKESIEAVKLFDATAATLLTMEFIKTGNRHSLQLKLIAKDREGQIWIVSSFLVGGKASTWPTPKSKLAVWLRAHVVSLTLTKAEVDQKSLDAAYKARDAKS